MASAAVQTSADRMATGQSSTNIAIDARTTLNIQPAWRTKADAQPLRDMPGTSTCDSENSEMRTVEVRLPRSRAASMCESSCAETATNRPRTNPLIDRARGIAGRTPPNQTGGGRM